MNHFFARCRARIHELSKAEEGQDLIEYALICSAIILVILATFPPFAAVMDTWFSGISNSIA
jgi:Flp pilus assembly pilin Flp